MTQPAWEKQRQEIIGMIRSGKIEMNNNIVLATIKDTDFLILTRIDLIPMHYQVIEDELKCIIEATRAEMEAWEDERRASQGQ